MNMRKITSMTMLVSLILLLINSVVLYIVPEGRVAYWADWHLVGLTKSEWGDQHITVGVLFLVAAVLHIIYNWAPIKAYMKNKAKEIKVFTMPFNIAMVVTILVAVGTYYNVPPMSTILYFSEVIKDGGSKKYGEPPYGHAELSSIKFFAKKEGLDPEKAVELLKQADMEVEGIKDTLKKVANNNGLTPQQVYDIIKPAKLEPKKVVVSSTGADGATSPALSAEEFPDHPRPGFGKRTLEEVCVELGINQNTIVAGLQGMGIKADPTMQIKEIGGESDKEPMEIYEAIRTLVLGE